MSEIKLFENEEFGEIRTVEINGEPHFVASDIAKALGYVRPADAITRHCRYTVKRSIPHPQSKTKTLEVNVIPEGDMYRLITHSELPSASNFESWVYDDVLPTLRKTGKYNMPKKQEKPKKKNLSSTNMMIKTVSDIFRNAGVDPIFIAAETKRLYKEEADIDIQIPLITDASMPKLYDCTEMAKELGILSNTGNPHNKAISAIIGKLNIEESEIITTAFSRKGHNDVTTQYKPSVVDKVKQWLSDNSYPDKIPYVDSKGNYKSYKVSYQCVEVA